MEIDTILDRGGYNEPTILLPGRHHEMARAILALGRSGNITPAMVPPLLVHLFSIAAPDAEDRDHHRGALALLANEGGFTNATTLHAGEPWREAERPPEWVFDERFTDVMHCMTENLRAEVGVSGSEDTFKVVVYGSAEQAKSDDYAQAVISYQPAIRVAVASIIGRDPGHISVLVRESPDPLKAKGIHAATPVPEAFFPDKVILPTAELCFGDRVRLWQVAPNDPSPMKVGVGEEFIVEGRTTASSDHGTHETLGLRSLAEAGGGYHRDFQGYRWEVVARVVPPAVKSDAQLAMERNAAEAGF